MPVIVSVPIYVFNELIYFYTGFDLLVVFSAFYTKSFTSFIALFAAFLTLFISVALFYVFSFTSLTADTREVLLVVDNVEIVPLV